MSQVKSEPEIKHDSKKPLLFAAIAIFSVFLIYMVSLRMMYPCMPVVERMAENIESYKLYYPPLRADEYTYYSIVQEFLRGSVYNVGSFARAYPAGFPLAAVPFVALFGVLGLYLTNIFIAIGCTVLFFLIVRRYCPLWLSLVLVFVLSFATLNWFYALSGYTEMLSQLLVLGSFYFMLPRADGKYRKIMLLLSGVMVALNLFVRPHYILLAAPFWLYLAAGTKNKKPAFDPKSIYFLAGCSLVMVLWLIRNVIVYDNPFTFEYSRMVTGYVPGAESNYMKGNVFLGIHRILFDVYHGLFTITPVLLLFPAGLRGMWLKGMRKESILLLVSVAIMTLFAASGPYPFTEFSLGSRHLVPIIPLMLFPSVFFVDKSLYSKSLLAILAMYSFYQAGFGWFTGGEPGMGFFLGILNDAQSRAIILARKGIVPPKDFRSREKLVDFYLNALKKADMLKFFQTLNPEMIAKINGHEREFMMYLRVQPDPTQFILSADPARKIIFKSFSLAPGPQEQTAQPNSSDSGN